MAAQRSYRCPLEAAVRLPWRLELCGSGGSRVGRRPGRRPASGPRLACVARDQVRWRCAIVRCYTYPLTSLVAVRGFVYTVFRPSDHEACRRWRCDAQGAPDVKGDPARKGRELEVWADGGCDATRPRRPDRAPTARTPRAEGRSAHTVRGSQYSRCFSTPFIALGTFLPGGHNVITWSIP